MSLSAGTHLGPYEVLGAIGAGGMGEVYQARDTRLKRTVAIKVLPRELSGDAQRRARLEREARTLASLSHPRICTLFDVGEHDGSTSGWPSCAPAASSTATPRPRPSRSPGPAR